MVSLLALKILFWRDENCNLSEFKSFEYIALSGFLQFFETNKYIYSSACDTEDTDDSKEPSPEPIQKPQQQPPPQPPLGKPPLHPQTLRGLIPKGGFKRVGPEIQQRIKEVCK